MAILHRDVKKHNLAVTSEPTLDQVSSRDEKWNGYRASNDTVRDLYENAPEVGDKFFYRLASRMNVCSLKLTFNVIPDGDKKLHLKSAYFCQVRACPVCSWRRSMRNAAKILNKMPDLLEAYPTHRWIFLTLTVKNCDTNELRSTISAMNKGWKRLIERKDWPATGWLRTTEITRSERGQAHPHFHILLHVPPSYFKGGVYVSTAVWAERWQSCMRLDYTPVVDVRAVKPNKKHGHSLESAIAEVSKYAVKPADLHDGEFLLSLTRQIHGLRFAASGGSLKGILKDGDVSNDELIHTSGIDEETGEELPTVDFGWRPSIKKYQRI